jgi:hypothetical protein
MRLMPLIEKLREMYKEVGNEEVYFIADEKVFVISIGQTRPLDQEDASWGNEKPVFILRRPYE